MHARLLMFSGRSSSESQSRRCDESSFIARSSSSFRFWRIFSDLLGLGASSKTSSFAWVSSERAFGAAKINAWNQGRENSGKASYVGWAPRFLLNSWQEWCRKHPSSFAPRTNSCRSCSSIQESRLLSVEDVAQIWLPDQKPPPPSLSSAAKESSHSSMMSDHCFVSKKAKNCNVRFP